MANVETARSHRFSQGRACLLVDMRTQLAFHHGIQERKNLAFRAGDLKFDATVRKISHPADYIEPFGKLPDRPPKPNALDIALVKNLKRDHAKRGNILNKMTRARKV